MKLLFDASSIFEALAEGKVLPLFEQTTIDLAMYELMNVLWKHVHLLEIMSRDEAQVFSENLKILFGEMNVTPIPEYMEQALEIAINFNISTYDTSYISVASTHNLILVSEDRKQKAVAQENDVATLSYLDLIHDNMNP